MDHDTIIAEADAALSRGDVEFAATLYERALGLSPGSVAALKGLGTAFERMGRPVQAVPCFEQVLALGEPGDASLFEALGRCHQRLRHFDSAAEAFERALCLAPDSARTLVRLAYSVMGRDAAGAVAHLKRAVELEPELAAAHDQLAFLLPKFGRFEEAREHGRRAFELSPENAGYGFRFVFASRFTEADDDALRRLVLLSRSQRLGEPDRIRVEFALGKAFEDLGEYEDSATHYNRANLVAFEHRTRFGHRFDAAEHVREVDAIIDAFPSPSAFGSRLDSCPSELPVLIVGMMRSGTTLVEQILSSHPAIGGAGEVPFWIEAAPRAHMAMLRSSDEPVCRSAAEEYVQLLAARAPGRDRICDKLPQNYMSLGTIHSLLPNARIVHCLRDSRDVCLSIYTTPFGVPPPFAFSPPDISAAYRQYLRLARHWRQTLPAERYLEVRYEELVENTEALSRKLVAFLGLEWNEACRFPEKNPRTVESPSQWQVRQPIHSSSVGRWRRYYRWLGSIIDAWTFDDR
jgi:tetratricopeptide (TPR) repeat protein